MQIIGPLNDDILFLYLRCESNHTSKISMMITASRCWEATFQWNGVFSSDWLWIMREKNLVNEIIAKEYVSLMDGEIAL